MSVVEAARLLGVTDQSVRNYAKANPAMAVQVGGKAHVRTDEFLAFVRASARLRRLLPPEDDPTVALVVKGPSTLVRAFREEAAKRGVTHAQMLALAVGALRASLR